MDITVIPQWGQIENVKMYPLNRKCERLFGLLDEIAMFHNVTP